MLRTVTASFSSVCKGSEPFHPGHLDKPAPCGYSVGVARQRGRRPKKHFQAMNRISRITSADWGAHIEATIKKAAPVAAAIITAAILTYEAGAWLRVTLEELNDSLAAIWATALGASNPTHAERVDELLLGVCMVAAIAWEWLTASDEPTTVQPMAVAAPPLAPPPSRPTPSPSPADPLKRGSRKR